jgi:hypothetical protein
MNWPKKHITWVDNKILHVSIPFTWELPIVKQKIRQRGFFWDSVLVGGPAVDLMPNYFDGMKHVKTGKKTKGVLQRINKYATKTTTGCIRNCKFCAVPKLEGKIKELKNWPDLPILCDNNLLAASQKHFDKVIDRLVKWKWADFNQGLDSRLLTTYHAKRIKEIKKPKVRLALDSMKYVKSWQIAVEKLLKVGIVKSNISSYVLIGFDSDPSEAWERCNFLKEQGIEPFPQWFHRLDAMKKNKITKEQKNLGWNSFERRKIMRWFYFYKKTKK